MRACVCVLGAAGLRVGVGSGRMEAAAEKALEARLGEPGPQRLS